MSEGQQNMINPKKKQNPYPECTKLSKASGVSNKIGEFLDWLIYTKKICLASYPVHCVHMGYDSSCMANVRADSDECSSPCKSYDEEESDRLHTTNITTEKLLAEFFEIDLDKVEKERCQMLEDLRKGDL